jgi:hypothetical protein
VLGFRLDQKGRLVGEAWVPKAGLSRDEFLLYVKRVADECDLGIGAGASDINRARRTPFGI